MNATALLVFAPSDGGDEKKGPSLRALKHDLAVAEQKLEQARIDQQAHSMSTHHGIEHAQLELELARARLQNFEERETVHRRTKAELELRQAKDRAQEAADELKQIELMYAEQDLNDMTAEFVIARGRRNAERAAARLELQASELDALVNHELPLERKKLVLDAERKEAALQKAKLDARSGELGKRIALMKAEEEIVRLNEKIAERTDAGAAATSEVAAPESAEETAPATGEAREW